MQRKKAVAVALAAAVLCFVGFASLEATELKWKFKEGETLYFKSVQHTMQEQMGMKITNDQVQYVEWKVVKVDGDTAVIDMTIKRIKSRMNNPMGGEKTYDSLDEKSKDVKDPMLAPNKVLVGKTITITMNDKGEVLSVKGYAEIGKELLKMIEEEGGGQMPMAMIKKSFESMFTNDFMKKNMNQTITNLPGKDVSEGDSWNEVVAFSIPMMGDITSKIVNTLVSVEGDTAKVAVKGKMTMEKKPEGGDKADPENPMAAIMKSMKISDGSLEGTVLFDTDRGVMTRKTLKTKMVLEMDMMGQKQKLPIDQELTFELISPDEVTAK